MLLPYCNIITMNLHEKTPPRKEEAEKLIDQLIRNSRLYTSSKSYLELVECLKKLRNFAPFNALLLHIQKPSVTHVASAADWWNRFGRKPKEGARPLLILFPFAPVALVYDFQDTEGKELPQDFVSFYACGEITKERIDKFVAKLRGKMIETRYIDRGDGAAGSIRRECIAGKKPGEEKFKYIMQVNQNHCVATQFVSIAHELGHLFLGHLGRDKNLSVPERRYVEREEREIEAEAVAYMVSARNGVESKSEKYLSGFVHDDTAVETLNLHEITRAAGDVEKILGLAYKASYALPEEHQVKTRFLGLFRP